MIFVDSDIILDLAQKREPFWNYSARLLYLGHKNPRLLCTTPIVLSNVFYIHSKYSSSKTATKFNLNLLRDFEIIEHSKEDFIEAYQSTMKDKEDAINYFTSLRHNLEAIITRNNKDFSKSTIPIFSAEEYLQKIS